MENVKRQGESDPGIRTRVRVVHVMLAPAVRYQADLHQNMGGLVSPQEECRAWDKKSLIEDRIRPFPP